MQRHGGAGCMVRIEFDDYEDYYIFSCDECGDDTEELFYDDNGNMICQFCLIQRQKAVDIEAEIEKYKEDERAKRR